MKTEVRGPKANIRGLKPTSGLLSGCCRQIAWQADVVAQRDVHEYVAAGGLTANYQSFGVLTVRGAVFGGVQSGGMHAEVKSLIVQGGDCVSRDLIGKLAHCFLIKSV